VLLVPLFSGFIKASADSLNPIPNPSMEISNLSNPNLPQSWSEGRWGTNSTLFSYPTTAHNGTRSVEVQVSNYVNGDAKWYFSPIAVTGGSTYAFNDYYISNVSTEVDAVFMNSSGVATYKYLGAVPASQSGWSQYASSFVVPSGTQSMTVYHLIASAGSLQIDDASISQVNILPQVSISNPLANSMVSGQVNLSAAASDNSGINNVQFNIDAHPVGGPVTSSPYSYSWDTTSTTNGTHTISATATNGNGVSVTSAPVSITVNNTLSNNIISNPTLETASTSNTSLPLNWRSGGWGTNTRSNTYLTTGHNGTRSIESQITSYTNGSDYWSSAPQPVTPGQMYDFSDYYQSTIISNVDALLTMSDGTTKDVFLGDPSPSPNGWSMFRTQFVIPAGAVSLSIAHNIYNVGWVITDDYNLSPFSYQGFNRPIISITSDDAYSSFVTNGLPLLREYGLNSTDYVITSAINSDSSHMSTAQLNQLIQSGNEIGSHTVTHPDLTMIAPSLADAELKNSQSILQSLLGIPITDFAAPYGTENQQVINDSSQYYKSYRGVQSGYNAKNNINPYNIMVQNLISTTTLPQVQSWITEAQQTNTWLVLVYHQIDPNTSAGEYNTYPSDFNSQLSAIKSSGVTVETVSQALQELQAQL